MTTQSQQALLRDTLQNIYRQQSEMREEMNNRFDELDENYNRRISSLERDRNYAKGASVVAAGFTAWVVANWHTFRNWLTQ